ncbi:MAG: Gfo/Idh/MocA family oxidoreductase [Planctomycetaceae bacterium]|nr:Gfo/Idh/MocA family oxidoreductase [Planctomycetaceae bacterium]
MNKNLVCPTSRRSFLKSAGQVAAASALVGLAVPRVHAGENNTIRIALIGCGGRGTGAAANALTAKGGPVQLVAMADVFDDRLKSSYENLSAHFQDRMDVPAERRFVGFDGYKQAMDCLAPGDIAIFATPPAFRGVHFAYAIEKGLHVFMEKPVTVDGPSTRRMLALAEASVQKNLKVGVGLMWRHCRARRALHDRIQAGEIGDIITLRAYRMHGPIGSFLSEPKSAGISDLMYQIRNFHSYIWASGGCYSDFYIHNIDECCWMKGSWPVEAQACGGRHYRGNYVDQNFDNYSVEYTFDDGTKLFLYGRCIGGCYDQFGSYVHGSQRQAIISLNAGMPSYSAIYRQQSIAPSQVIWKFTDHEPNPYDVEWEDLLLAIRQDQPYNEAQRGAEASLVSSMGRMAAHTGQVVTYDEMLQHPHDMALGVETLTFDSPSPLMPGPDGKYPVPQPGLVTDREY